MKTILMALQPKRVSVRLVLTVAIVGVALGVVTSASAKPFHKRAKPLVATITPNVPPAAKFPAGGSWHAVTSPPLGAFRGGAGAILQLTDGRVLVHENCSRNWWTLTPNAKGSYLKGKWNQVASLPAGYGPLYFSSAVLRDGRVIINGGEYNNPGSGCPQNGSWTTLGAIYDPVKDAWKSVNPPSGWKTIGDAQNVVLPDGTFWLANCCTAEIAQLDPSTLTWTSVSSTGKATSDNDEEGWTLMPDGSILTVDAVTANTSTSHAERYYQGAWHDAGNTVKLNASFSLCGEQTSYEMGPQVLMPNGKVFAIGATGHNAIYTPGTSLTDTGSWAAGPDFPTVGTATHADDVADGPAALLPSGNVLVMASPCVFTTPSHFYEFNGTSLVSVSEPPNAPVDSSFYGRLMVLPTGEILFTDYSADVEIYSPKGSPKTAWKPVITNAPKHVTQGQKYKITGKRFNGMSQANAYGDDSSSASNYPLVRITHTATGAVTYGRTFNHSSMGVAVAGTVHTNVQIPRNAPTGAGTLEVVANGIASDPVAITVVAHAPTVAAE